MPREFQRVVEFSGVKDVAIVLGHLKETVGQPIAVRRVRRVLPLSFSE